MGPASVTGSPAYTRLDQLLRHLNQVPTDAFAAYQAADLAVDHGFEAEACPAVALAARRIGNEPRLWQMLGLLHRGTGQSDLAMKAFARAAALSPEDARIMHGLALVTLEAGLPAVEAYDRALALAPEDGQVILGKCSALAAERRPDLALSFLADQLRQRPGWTEGHQGFASLCVALGAGDRATDTIDAALANDPGNVPLHACRLGVIARKADPAEQLRSIALARPYAGDQPVFLVSEAIASSEMGDIARADRLFMAIGRHSDPALALALLRHLVRAQRFDQVDGLAGKLIAGPETVTAWAYRQIAWRATGDRRLDWLERGGALVRRFDILETLPPLDRLADVLRAIHVTTAQPLDQSVRGGTQTEGPLFSRIEPEIRQVRAAVEGAVARYCAELPPSEAGHPLLSAPRGALPRFAGSWSVRLRGSGFHVNHIHGQGWLSSALYVALPDSASAGEEGVLTIGAPPVELDLGMGPTRTIMPEVGELVLFPSWQWHGVTPFNAGERLTIAFDVARSRV